MEKKINEVLSSHRYFGRGILIGQSPDSQSIFLAYFLMGRSPNSQNRIFYTQGNDVKIDFFDPKCVQDSSLIFYPPIVHHHNQIIITNGDQTSTILESLQQNKTFQDALRQREFEPDAPHFTPRISALITLSPTPTYQMSILKAFHNSCNRFFYEYESIAGIGHLIHTYAYDSHPLPSFLGEPKALQIPSTLEEFATLIWNHLDAEYKISLCVQSIHLHTQQVQTLIFNTKEK